MQGCIKRVCTEFKYGCLYVVEPSRCTDAPTINDHDCNGRKTIQAHTDPHRNIAVVIISSLKGI